MVEYFPVSRLKIGQEIVLRAEYDPQAEYEPLLGFTFDKIYRIERIHLTSNNKIVTFDVRDDTGKVMGWYPDMFQDHETGLPFVSEARFAKE